MRNPISEVRNCDCMEYMRTLPDNFFDLAICDPPYGNGKTDNDSLPVRFGGRFDKYAKGWNRFQSGTRMKYCKTHDVGMKRAAAWDVAPPQKYFDELFRVSKNQIIWGGNYFCLPPTRCFLVWKKTNIPENFSMAMAEYAWTSFKDCNAKVFEALSQRGKHSGKFHPTEKPLALYAWCLRLFAKPGNRIFDPNMGSQASRIAAYKLGFDYYGCEIDECYFNKGCEFFERECHGKESLKNGKTATQKSLFE